LPTEIGVEKTMTFNFIKENTRIMLYGLV